MWEPLFFERALQLGILDAMDGVDYCYGMFSSWEPDTQAVRHSRSTQLMICTGQTHG
jgi:hypothetical protein